jgi:tubulin polyglutamylase TTLL1/tubulin monoglycylase TTLL3/8
LQEPLIPESKAVDESKFQPPPGSIIYKYFIGKGNNSIMVRSLFKNRFWWVQHDKEEMEKCNFCWTQIKKANLMEVLTCKFPNKKSGVKNLNSLPAQLATPQ